MLALYSIFSYNRCNWLPDHNPSKLYLLQNVQKLSHSLPHLKTDLRHLTHKWHQVHDLYPLCQLLWFVLWKYSYLVGWANINLQQKYCPWKYNFFLPILTHQRIKYSRTRTKWNHPSFACVGDVSHFWKYGIQCWGFNFLRP